MRFSAECGCIGSTGAVRSSAWIWLFSSTHNTIALVGGARYNPTTSVTFATSSGSVENLNVSERQGCTPYSRQAVAMVLLLIPKCFPRRREDQCVTPYLFGGDANVIETILRWSIVRGRPERASSSSPGTPFDMYRLRHAITVFRDTPTLLGNQLV